MSWRIGLDLATAREKVSVARALGGLPAIDRALAAGKLSYAKVRAMTRIATPQNEQRLLDLGLAATGAQLERICRGYRAAAADAAPARLAQRFAPVSAHGMVKLEMVLSADEADLVLRAIDRAREERHEAKAAETPTASAAPSKAPRPTWVAARDPSPLPSAAL